MPLAHLDLCHPIAQRTPFTREGWIFELKHDGFRALARSGRSAVQLLLRSGRAMADAFPEIVAALEQVPPATLDAELVVPTAEGRSDFEEVRRRNLLQRPRMIAEAAARRPAVLVVFDLLQLDGEDLRALPLFERRARLHRHIESRPRVQLIEHVETTARRSSARSQSRTTRASSPSVRTRPTVPARAPRG